MVPACMGRPGKIINGDTCLSQHIATLLPNHRVAGQLNIQSANNVARHQMNVTGPERLIGVPRPNAQQLDFVRSGNMLTPHQRQVLCVRMSGISGTQPARTLRYVGIGPLKSIRLANETRGDHCVSRKGAVRSTRSKMRRPGSRSGH